MKKIRIISLILIFIISYIYINLVQNYNVKAVVQITTSDINAIDEEKYPGIKNMIQNLQTSHPNWTFKLLYTGIDWGEAIAQEYSGHTATPKNLVPYGNSNYAGDWVCPICGPDKVYDSGNWVCASTQAIKYMMDPRNSLNDLDVFQFLELSYKECDCNSLKVMARNTFMDNDSYLNAVIEAGKNNNINPYYLTARILQEQGATGSVMIFGNGYNGQYEGYYNIFNIKASGSSKEQVILNGLKKAQTENWNSIETSIIGGSKIIASQYISIGQNTLYLQKFDVDNSDGELYWHQYMQNILAAQSEGSTLRRTFSNVDAIDGAYTFLVPVYENMPQNACSRPSTTNDSLDNIASAPEPQEEKVTVNVTSSLSLRTSPNGTRMSQKLFANEVVTRVQKATEKVAGTYWDLVKKEDGTTGYAARETYDYEEAYKLYLIPVCQENDNIQENNDGQENDNSQETGNEQENIMQHPNIENNQNIQVEEVYVSTNDVIVNMENKTVLVNPNITVKEILEIFGTDANIIDKNGNKLGENDIIGTGAKIKDSYVVTKIGDVNGDGNTNALDAAIILRFSVNQYNLENEFLQAANVTCSEDGATALDAARILRYSVGQFNISL